MSEAEAQFKVLEARAPGLARALSPLGRAVVFPKGIPWQADQAKSTRLNATIGQITDGAGGPLPLPSLAATVPGLDAKMAFLYSPQPGHLAVRQRWRARQLHVAGRAEGVCTMPYATHGLVHGLSIAADLFVDADTTIVLPDPSWENYELVFGMRTGAQVAAWPFYANGRLNVEGLASTLAGVKGKALLVLNFPSNPTGYSPTRAEADQLVAMVRQHPGSLVVVVDDAYQGVVHDAQAVPHSLYWDLAEAADPSRHVILKVDGATKELLFFPSRIGFISLATSDAEVENIWINKLNGLVRGTVGSPPGPSQAMMMAGLADFERLDAEFADVLSEIRARYDALKGALAELKDPRILHLPFNAAFFALVGLHASVDAETVRQRLVAERSVGLVTMPGNHLRIAYCSARAEHLVEIVKHLGEIVASMA